MQATTMSANDWPFLLIFYKPRSSARFPKNILSCQKFSVIINLAINARTSNNDDGDASAVALEDDNVDASAGWTDEVDAWACWTDEVDAWACWTDDVDASAGALDEHDVDSAGWWAYVRASAGELDVGDLASWTCWKTQSSKKWVKWSAVQWRVCISVGSARVQTYNWFSSALFAPNVLASAHICNNTSVSCLKITWFYVEWTKKSYTHYCHFARQVQR